MLHQQHLLMGITFTFINRLKTAIHSLFKEAMGDGFTKMD